MCTVPMKPLPITAVPMSLRRVTGGDGPPGGSAGCLPSSLDGLRVEWRRIRGAEPAVARSTAVGAAGRRRSRFGSCVRRRLRGFLRWSSYFDLSSAKVPSTGLRDARMIAAMGGGSIPPRDTVPGPVPEEALDALVAVLDEVRLGPLAVAQRARRAHRPRRAASSPSGSPSCSIAGLVVEGDPGPSTGGRPPRQLTFRADAGHVLVADLGATVIDVAVTTLDGRILGHHDEPAEHRGRPGRRARPGRGAVRPAARDDARPARADLGHRHRRARAGRVPHRPADLAADHARLGRLSRPRAVRGPLRRAGLGRQRRQRARARRVAVRRRRRATTTWSSSRSAPGIGAGIIADGRLHRGAQGSAGDVGHIQVSDDRRRRSAAAATSAASRRWPAARRSPATGRRRRARAGACGCARRWTGAGR